MKDAACRGENVDLFFEGETEAAKNICATCVVQEPCLETALEGNIHYGVWGGLDPNQRRALKRKRR